MDKQIDRSGKNRKRIIYSIAGIIIIIILSLLWVSSFSSSRLKVEKSKLNIAAVKQEVFEEFVPVTGTVQPIQTVFVDAKEGGTVEKIFVEDGKFLEAGTPILRLSNQQLQMDAINREAQLLDQQNNLRNTLLNMDKQILQHKEELLELDNQLKEAKRNYEMNKKLSVNQNVSKNEMEKSEEQYEYLQGKKGLLLQKIKSDSLFRANQSGQIIFSLNLIQKNLEFLQKSLESLIIKAPVKGQLSALRAELGESKTKGEKLGQVDVVTAYKIRATVNEHYTAKVSIGTQATFSFNGREYKLSVFKIYPEVNNGEFALDLKFENEMPDGIKRGQSLSLKLLLSREQQALLVSRGSFYNETGGKWIYVLNNEKAVKRNISIGRQNPDYYEILDGITVGEQVIVSGYGNFNNADELILQ